MTSTEITTSDQPERIPVRRPVRIPPPSLYRPISDPPCALKLAKAQLIGRLLEINPAAPIVGSYADPCDITDRAEHIEKVLTAVTDYVKAILADTVDYVPAGAFVARDLSGLLNDTVSDVVGGVQKAAEECGERG